MNDPIAELTCLRNENTRLQNEVKSTLQQINDLQLELKQMAIAGQPYKSIIQELAISIWEVDLSKTLEVLLKFQADNLSLRAYLETDKNALSEVLATISFIDVNDYTLKHYKAHSQQQLYSCFNDLLTPEAMSLMIDLAIALVEGDKTFTGETVILDLEGKRYPSIVNVCFHSGDFDYSHVIWGVVDISVQKESEEEVRKSEERLRTILKAIPDLIYLFDRDGYYLDYYTSDPSKLKAIPLGLLGHHIRDIFPAEVVERILEAFRQSLETKEIQLLEYELTTAGVKAYYEFRIVPAGPDEIIALTTDITERKKAEKVRNATYRISELAITTNSLDELYSAIHRIIGELMPANNIYFALYDPDINGLNFPYFVDEHDHTPAPRRLKKGLTEYILRTGRPMLTNPAIINQLVSKGEIEIMGTLTYDWLGVPLKTKDRIIGVLVVQSYKEDIRYTESDKDMLIFVSEQVAMAIDRRIREEELKKAKVTAEESSKLKSTLLANLSHEFRTPMNGILNYARLLKETLAGDPKAEMAETIYSSGDRLLSTLDSIMNLAQIEASNIKMEISKVDIGHSIHNTVLHFETEAQEKGLNFEYKFDDEVLAYCDVTLINQITKYLLDNAIKFTQKGKIGVYVRSVLLGGKHWAELEVKDTGIGISKQDLEVIFHEFRQVSSGYGRSHEGSGLGLTLCKKMAELMNGRIIVDSSAGQGSSFYLRLPQAMEPLLSKKQTAKSSEILVASTQQKTKLAVPPKIGLSDVLIVEDNQVNMELTVMFLNGVCNTDRAKDGITAIKMSAIKKYDAILMDINLGPGMNGLEASMEIRKIPGYENTPIVAVTGYTLSGDREKMLQGGCTHYLPKPFDKKGIINIVKEILGNKEIL
ncbi:MAG: ATP-binding protein [Bacteroidales bacterium]